VRYTKFVKSSQTSEISCKGEESFCGVLSDYAQGERLYAFQCCENSNTQSVEGSDEEQTETINLQGGSFHEFKERGVTKVIKSFKIVSFSESSVTYSVTFSKFKSCSSRFQESTTNYEYSGKTEHGSGSASKESGKKKKKGKSSSAKKGSGGKKSGGKKSGDKHNSGAKKGGGSAKGGGSKKGGH